MVPSSIHFRREQLPKTPPSEALEHTKEFSVASLGITISMYVSPAITAYVYVQKIVLRINESHEHHGKGALVIEAKAAC